MSEEKRVFCDYTVEQSIFVGNKEVLLGVDKKQNIVGKVVVMNAEPKRYEYQHSAYQLVVADGGNGATGGRGQAVFGTCLATGKRARWERYDVMGEIRPERMPEWAAEALAKIQTQEKAKKPHHREER